MAEKHVYAAADEHTELVRNFPVPFTGHMSHLPLYKMAAILADDIFKCIFFNENDGIQISMKLIPKSLIDNKPALVQEMAWHNMIVLQTTLSSVIFKENLLYFAK